MREGEGGRGREKEEGGREREGEREREKVGERKRGSAPWPFYHASGNIALTALNFLTSQFASDRSGSIRLGLLWIRAERAARPRACAVAAATSISCWAHKHKKFRLQFYVGPELNFGSMAQGAESSVIVGVT